MRINTNTTALSLQSVLAQNVQRFDQSAQRLSTGVQINRAADDPAGLISSDRLGSVLATLDAETRVLQRQDHVVSTADAALSEVSNALVETQALQAQLGDGAMPDAERAAIQMQIDANVQSAGRIASSAGFNGVGLFSGEASLAFAEETLDLPRMDAETIGQTQIDDATFALDDVASGGALVGDVASAGRVIGAALDQVAAARGRIGAYRASAIEPAMTNTLAAIENTAEAESVIRDTDFAAEVAEMNRNAMLTNANALVFSQATFSSRAALDLLA